MRAIESIDQAGRVRRFASVRAAERAGYIRENIHKCLSGRLKRHRGCYWRYQGGADPPGVRPWIDGLRRLPAFVGENCTDEPGRPVYYVELLRAINRWLPRGEEVREEDVSAWVRERYDVTAIGQMPNKIIGLYWLSHFGEVE